MILILFLHDALQGVVDLLARDLKDCLPKNYTITPAKQVEILGIWCTETRRVDSTTRHHIQTIYVSDESIEEKLKELGISLLHIRGGYEHPPSGGGDGLSTFFESLLLNDLETELLVPAPI